MPEFDLFALYRRLVVILVGTYSVIRLLQAIWRWRADSLRDTREQALLRHWVELSVLRVRMHRFTFDVVQIGLLAAILGYVAWLQVGHVQE